MRVISSPEKHFELILRAFYPYCSIASQGIGKKSLSYVELGVILKCKFFRVHIENAPESIRAVEQGSGSLDDFYAFDSRIV